jgi:integrase
MELFRKYKTIEEVLPGFLLEKQVGIQAKSFYPYNWCSKVFIDWLSEHGLLNQPMRKITSDNVKDFFYFIGLEKELDRTTCEKYYLNLRQLFEYAKKRKEINDVPFDDIILPRKKRNYGAEVITDEDLKILLPVIKSKDPQLYLASMIQYYCFIRPGKELRLMLISDIDLVNGLLTVRQELAKNKRRQVVTVPDQLLKIFHEYEIHKADKTLYVFGNKKRFGRVPCSVNMLRWRFNKIRDELKLSKGYKFYSMKHTGAKKLHLSGLPMFDQMNQMRHTKLDVTQRYLGRYCGTVNNQIRDNFPSPI